VAERAEAARRSFSREVETAVLIESRRRCALCFGFDGDLAKKRGQLAHVDRDSSNASKGNAAFLCMPHHDEYDSVPRLTKRITPDELKSHRNALYETLAVNGILEKTKILPPRRTPERTSTGVSLEVYDRRISIYRTTIQFLREVNASLNPDLKVVVKFGTDTEEALFLFDETIANHLAEIVRNAFRLRAVSQSMSGGFTQAIAEQEIGLSTWFYEQFQETRKKFVPFLRLAR
jgi:hypothetical protein